MTHRVYQQNEENEPLAFVRFLKAQRYETELCRGLSWLNTVAPAQNYTNALF